MKEIFKVGQNSLGVSQLIVEHHPEILRIGLITHRVGVNWRQKNMSHSEKVKNLVEGFKHNPYLLEKYYSRKDFLNLTLENLPRLKNHEVWSIRSKVLCRGNKFKHIPMMNFHPYKVPTDIIEKNIKHAYRGKKGVLLNSGRFFHYYGDFLLDEKEWLEFMAFFLMPCIIVSPRYIGHCLYFGNCTLRLTSDTKYKPKIPTVYKIL